MVKVPLAIGDNVSSRAYQLNVYGFRACNSTPKNLLFEWTASVSVVQNAAFFSTVP